MKSVWTWSGKSLGYIDGEDLWTNKGKHIGKFYEGEIYCSKGTYIGEIMDGERLIYCQEKKHLKSAPFRPYKDQATIKACNDFAGYAMYTGYQGFPDVAQN
ncbi:4-fold beta flower protein [Vibrio sp. 10N.261.55.A7]|uniref:4-fold beta flower protein n=1 Tax=Vibrio sp. 10N.261.55.A7 TaxID=1880851 RepID=UPI000C83538E|nr:hypothetical protein [Vibrio sp. 10N.261.55.A7]PMJ91690.1 hypothetical protein BCU12_08910 [Vibrio sp. 10N.261.55.A7]